MTISNSIPQAVIESKEAKPPPHAILAAALGSPHSAGKSSGSGSSSGGGGAEPARQGRTRRLIHPVTVTLDGEEVVAERGEPLCAAFVAAGKLPFARSPKFHRPRGPACLRAACDGCLARVDEAPNVMTCQVAAEEGTRVVTQNRLGPRDADLLRMTDWFFPDGLNHHEILAGVPGLQNVMQVFARKVAGLGRLPAESAPVQSAARRRADVIVVGSGPSGMAVATQLAAAGRTVEVLDDQLKTGGGLAALAPSLAKPFGALRSAFDAAVGRGAVLVRQSTVVGGVYGRDLLVVGPNGAEILEASALVLACGGHDGVLAFEGNDIPGVMSARAAGWLLADGVLVGEMIAIVVAPGGGPFGASYAQAIAEARDGMVRSDAVVPSLALVSGIPVAVHGSRRVKRVVVNVDGEERTIAADAVLIDAPRAPAYELAEQAGGRLTHEPRGYVVQTDDGLVAEGVFAVGEMTGVPLEAKAIEADAARTARRILG